MQNIEFKAELRDPELARRQCELLGARRGGILEQIDVYYKMPDGRLKRRETDGGSVQWILYHRPDKVQPKLSNYAILTDRQARARWGTASLRPWITVAKTRELWTIDNTRIHLDEVESLGRFIEFEAIVGEQCDLSTCRAIVEELRERFGPLMGEPIAASYADLLAREQAAP